MVGIDVRNVALAFQRNLGLYTKARWVTTLGVDAAVAACGNMALAGVEMTAATGTRKDAKNAQRGLMRHLQKGSKMPEPYYAEIPVAEKPGSKKQKLV